MPVNCCCWFCGDFYLQSTFFQYTDFRSSFSLPTYAFLHDEKHALRKTFGEKSGETTWKSMKKLLGSTVPFLIFHFFCCGALLFYFTASGYLLLMREEGRNKYFLIPALIMGGLLFYLYHRHGKCCEQKDHKNYQDHFISLLLYIGFSLIIGLAFMIYVFIPWWIPNYKGGFLLP